MLVCVHSFLLMRTRPRVQHVPGIPCAALFRERGRKVNAKARAINAPRERGWYEFAGRATNFSVVPGLTPGPITPKCKLLPDATATAHFNNSIPVVMAPGFRRDDARRELCAQSLNPIILRSGVFAASSIGCTARLGGRRPFETRCALLSGDGT